MKQKHLPEHNLPAAICRQGSPGLLRTWIRAGKVFLPLCMLLGAACWHSASAQIILQQNYQNRVSAPIGTYQGINFREAGFSSLFAIPSTSGKEYWTISDRGPNIDDANANPNECKPTYDKMFPFPVYTPKIHRIRVDGDSVQILQTITMKRPDGSGATGLMNPTGLGSTATEVVSTDTVQNCANFNQKTYHKDVWGIDSEGILVDKDGNFWISEEGGPTVWKLSPSGVVINRYTPYGDQPGLQPQDIGIDTVFKYRKNNRGFESLAIAPNGKLYAFIQSPLLFPDAATGNATRVHRILEINPATNATRMFAYLNDGVTGTGGNQIRLQDWKLGDASAINDTTFLVLEAAARGTTDIKRMYLVNIGQATPVGSGLYGTKTLEGLVDEATLNANGIKPVTKTLFMDLLANGWPSALDKAEGLAIVNDSTIAVCNDNDFGASSPNADGIATATTNTSHVLVYNLKGANKIPNYQPLNALPLRLTSFTGSLVNGQASLTWNTDDEVNTSRFEVEKSLDGLSFNTLVIVPAAGHGRNQYQRFDVQPANGNNYYRLKMIDVDGKLTYSPILLVKVGAGGKSKFLVYPNPVKDQLVISPSGFTGMVKVNIFNQQGQIVLSRQMAAATTTIPVEQLARGVYTVQVIAAGISEIHKVIKE